MARPYSCHGGPLRFRVEAIPQGPGIDWVRHGQHAAPPHDKSRPIIRLALSYCGLSLRGVTGRRVRGVGRIEQSGLYPALSALYDCLNAVGPVLVTLWPRLPAASQQGCLLGGGKGGGGQRIPRQSGSFLFSVQSVKFCINRAPRHFISSKKTGKQNPGVRRVGDDVGRSLSQCVTRMVPEYIYCFIMQGLERSEQFAGSRSKHI